MLFILDRSRFAVDAWQKQYNFDIKLYDFFNNELNTNLILWYKGICFNIWYIYNQRVDKCKVT